MDDVEIENTEKLITSEMISDFLKCEYKAYQKYNNISGIRHDIEIVEQKIFNKYKVKYFSDIKYSSPTEKVLSRINISGRIQLDIGSLFFY